MQLDLGEKRYIEETWHQMPALKCLHYVGVNRVVTEVVKCAREAARSQDVGERPEPEPPSLLDGRRPAFLPAQSPVVLDRREVECFTTCGRVEKRKSQSGVF